jgi:histidine triad (HIT) family protein
MYKAKPPFGTYNTRSDALQEIIRQLTIIENLMVPPIVIDDSNTNNENTRPYYLCGNEVSLADATIFPTMVFATYMLPKFDITVPPKLQEWYNQLLQYDPDFRKVQQEIMDPLQVWDTINHRWDTILGAGWRDTAPSTIFDQIINGTIPATKIDVSDDTLLAFRDINPVAPAHVLLIPKHRYGLTQLSMATSEHTEILGRLLVAAASMARNESIGFGPNGCRIVINDGNYGGQEVMHLHVHLLGGRPMSWPPG